jgi:hypothetical protein
VGLSTPAVFKALDLSTRSTENPLALLGLHTTGAEGPDKHVNDLEPPAFSVVPELAKLKDYLVGCGFSTVSDGVVGCYSDHQLSVNLQFYFVLSKTLSFPEPIT